MLVVICQDTGVNHDCLSKPGLMATLVREVHPDTPGLSEGVKCSVQKRSVTASWRAVGW